MSPICFYIYFGPTSGEMPTIGVVNTESPNCRAAAVAVQVVETTDLEQAERWRSTLAAGNHPNLVTDPPIVDENQVSARTDEIRIEGGEIVME